MTFINGATTNLGKELASRLGMNLPRVEGHDLAGPCIACESSDAFRLHRHAGIAQCYSCGGKWSPFQLAETVLGDRNQSRDLLIELGALSPTPGNNSESTPTNTDPIDLIARQKGVTKASLVAFGAEDVNSKTIRLPAYGPDGTPCTTFTMSPDGRKGLFEKGKPAGLFFPHEGGKVRLPKPNEIWHLLEGPKDAAALHGLNLLACGLNTCRLAAKFARLFVGIDVVLVPDRDHAGEEGAQHSARVLRGIAKTIRVAVLPSESKESGGEDVRDILRRPEGRALVEQALADAQLVEALNANLESTPALAMAMAQVELPEGDPLTITVHPPGGGPQRLVVVTRDDFEFRDNINTNSSISRDRLTKKIAKKLDLDQEDLAALLDPQILQLADQSDELKAASPRDDDEQSQATLAANMAADWELWHTPAKDAFVTFPVGEHSETWPVKSQTFKRYIAKQFFEAEGKAMNSDALSSAVNLIEAKALFDGDECQVHVRIAEHGGKVYLDLCDDSWQVVEIRQDGWDVIPEAPVKFRRSKGMLPLPMPRRDGVIDELRKFLNVDDTSWILIVAWLIGMLCPRGPYPILALFAEQGSGKSTTGRLLRSLVDPNSAPLRAEPKDERDLMIAGNNAWCLAFDNLSRVPSWLSDAMCRLSTGGGFATRELYTDMDEIIFDSQRPMLLTSIEEVAARSDLLDRCLIVWLPTIPEDRRRPEAEMLMEFETARPRILGALLNAVSAALRNRESVDLPCLPRMADFAMWVTAAEGGLGWQRGTFMSAYNENRSSANDLALESSPIARPLIDLLEECGGWDGTATELLHEIESQVSEQSRRQRGWPANGRSIAGHLKRLAPNLRVAGWVAENSRNAKKRGWTIERVTQTNAAPDPFASSENDDSRVSANSDGPFAMQFDEDWPHFPGDDAYDANDANSGTLGDSLHAADAEIDDVPF